MGKLLIYDETLLRARLRERRLRACALFLAGALCGFGLARSAHLLEWAQSAGTDTVIAVAHAATARSDDPCQPRGAPGLKLDCRLRQAPAQTDRHLASGSRAH